MIPRGRTRKIVNAVGDIQTSIEKAIGVIDTRRQYEIREHLTEALSKCHEIRNMYDPL